MTDLVRLIVELIRSVWGWVVFLSPVKIKIVEDGESTLDGSIRVLERAKANVETVLRALREADIEDRPSKQAHLSNMSESGD